MSKILGDRKKEPYYIVRNKLILSQHISDLDIISLIMDMLLKKNNIIIKYNKGGIFRSLKLLKINLFLYKLIKQEIEELLGFQISKKEKDASYSLIEINSIGYFLKNFTIQDTSNSEMIMSFDDFCLCEPYDKNDKTGEYKIISTSEDKYVKYDSVCGLDILLILAIKLYGLKCKKISKKNREMLKIKGTPVIAC